MKEIYRLDLEYLKVLTQELNDKDKEIQRYCDILSALNNSLPIMVWAKDENMNYLFANKFCCTHLLNTNIKEVVGKNDMFFAERERQSHPGNKKYHTFGEECNISDQEVLRTKNSLHKTESGYCKGNLLTIEIWKEPFWREGNILGIAGAARIVD